MSDSNVYFPQSRVKRYYTKSHQIPVTSRNPYIRPILFVLFLAIAGFGIYRLRHSSVTGANSGNAGIFVFPSATPMPTVTPQPRDLTELIKTVTEITESHTGDYSVRFEDLNSKDAFGIRDDVVLDAVSVNKIPFLAALYYFADRGEIDLDREITIAPRDVQNYGTGSIYTRQPPHIYTVRELARLMIEVSDNTAAYVMANRVMTRTQIQDLLNEWGMTDTEVVNGNTTSNRDQAKVLRLMFEGKVANPELTREMIGWLDDSIFENRLPAQLPEDVNVYHKIGNQVSTYHDVGVIEFDNNRYYLGVMITGIPSELEANITIAEISKAVYDFYKE